MNGKYKPIVDFTPKRDADEKKKRRERLRTVSLCAQDSGPFRLLGF